MEDYAKFNIFKLWSAVLKFGDSTIRLGGVLVWPFLYWWLFYISSEKLSGELSKMISEIGGVLLTLSSGAFLIRWPIYFKKLKDANSKIHFYYYELLEYLLNMESIEEIKKAPEPKQLANFRDSIFGLSDLLHLNFMEKTTEQYNEPKSPNSLNKKRY